MIKKSVAVVGLGAVGSMVLWSLAKRGADVVGFEMSTIGGDSAAYGGGTRQLRLASRDVHAHQHVKLITESLRLWRELEGDFGEQIYIPTGQLAIGPVDNPEIIAHLHNLDAEGIEHEVLTPAALHARFPQHRLADDEIGVYAVEAGVLRSNKGVVAAVNAAHKLGTRVHTNARVAAIEPTAKGVEIRVGDETSLFDHVVLTVGPWIAQLAPELAQAVIPRSIVCSWFEPRSGTSLAPDAFPPGFRRSKDGHSYTFLPAVDRTAAKFVFWIPTRPVVDDVDSWDEPVDMEAAAMSKALQATTHGIHPDPSESSSYSEGFTADRWPIVGPLLPDVTVLTGFSGNGFALAPAMGEIAADLALSGTTSRDIVDMAVGRPTLKFD